MSTKGTKNAAALPSSSPTVDLNALAQKYIQALRAMREEIPEFIMPQTALSQRQVLC